jgi:hypothetical protein
VLMPQAGDVSRDHTELERALTITEESLT